MVTLTVELPDCCDGCGFKNLKIWGTRIDERIYVEVRCMRCGKMLWEART